MSAFRFYTDAQGHICGGHALTGTLSSETWRVPEPRGVRLYHRLAQRRTLDA